jgi:hypothetical protein
MPHRHLQGSEEAQGAAGIDAGAQEAPEVAAEAEAGPMNAATIKALCRARIRCQTTR